MSYISITVTSYSAFELVANCKLSNHLRRVTHTVYPKKYAHGFCLAVLCCCYTLIDFPISIRLTTLALWQSNDCPSASKATLMNMDKYFMWIHYERLHNHNKAKHNKTVCIFLGIYPMRQWTRPSLIHKMTYTLFGAEQSSKLILFVIGPLETNLIKTESKFNNKLRMKMSPAKWQSSCRGFSVLTGCTVAPFEAKNQHTYH